VFNRDSSKYPLLALTVPYELLVAKAGFLAKPRAVLGGTCRLVGYLLP
jgi:hypothetical protein